MAIEQDKVKTETRTSRTLGDDDDGAFILCTNASAVTITVPASLPAGFQCTIAQRGAGAVSLSAASGVSFDLPSTATSPPVAAEEGSTFGITKIVETGGAEVFMVYGALG